MTQKHVACRPERGGFAQRLNWSSTLRRSAWRFATPFVFNQKDDVTHVAWQRLVARSPSRATDRRQGHRAATGRWATPSFLEGPPHHDALLATTTLANCRFRRFGSQSARIEFLVLDSRSLREVRGRLRCARTLHLHSRNSRGGARARHERRL